MFRLFLDFGTFAAGWGSHGGGPLVLQVMRGLFLRGRGEFAMQVLRFLLGAAFGRRAPRLDGRVRVSGSGSDESVLIARDRWGVPHVEARTEADAWFGLGYCHGQDRAFQLEFLLRVIRGTLAELVGPSGLAVDRLSRRIGFRRAALVQGEVLDPDVRSWYRSYVAGINAAYATGLRRRPHEMALLRGRLTRWDSADALGMSKLMAFLLPANWDGELSRMKVLQLDGAQALRALDHGHVDWLPVTWPPGTIAGSGIDRLSQDVDRFLAVTGRSGGSNNWVVSPRRTTTGRPLLANDMHLSPASPPHFYLADLRCPAWHAVGASLVGSLGIFAGHNDSAGWGVTAGLVDNTDLCLEEISADGRSVRRGDTFVTCDVSCEVIGVKGSAPVVEEVILTPEGPVIGPALEGELDAVSMRATWLEPRRLRGLLELVRCRTSEDFHTCLADFPAISQNVVFACTDGTIGWQLVGEPPVRRSGDGTFPSAGADTESGWTEVAAFSKMPRGLEPACGWIATANNPPQHDADSPFLGVDFTGGYRVARIGEVLDAREDWDVAAMAKLQLDTVSIPWREMRTAVLDAAANHAPALAVTRQLAAWDGQVSAESPAATVFELFLSDLATRVARAKAPHSVDWALGRGFHPLSPQSMFRIWPSTLATLITQQPDGWFPHPWAQVIAESLRAVEARLVASYGTDEARWAWGRVRPLRFVHPAGTRPPLGRIFNQRPVPGCGDTTTICQEAVGPEPAENTGFTAGLRMVLDVGDWSNSRWSLPGGQSGNPTSRHYDDQLSRFQDGSGISIPWTREEVSKATRHTLHLLAE